MRDPELLPERVDGTTVDVERLVAGVDQGRIRLDWAHVSEADADTVKAILEPFEGRYEELGDALGIWSQPPAVEPAVNWALGEGPRPEREPAAWLFLQNPDSPYGDEAARSYEFPATLPNGRRVSTGDSFALAVSSRQAPDGKRVFAVGKIAAIEELDVQLRRAVFGEHEFLERALTFEELGGDPRPNPSNAINRIPRAFVDRVRAVRDDPDGTLEGAGTSEPCEDPDFDLDSPSGVRDALHRLMELDLLGPACGEEEELLQDPPRTRYVVGTLSPKNGDLDPLGEDDELGGAGEDSPDEGNVETRAPVSDSLFASSIGFTFVVGPGVERIRVRVSWGSYDRVPSEFWFTEHGTAKMVWKRRPRGSEFDLPLESGPVLHDPDGDVPDVRVKGRIRSPDADGSRLVTLFLVNDQTVRKEEHLKDRKWIFQPEIRVEASGGPEPVFVRRDQIPEYDPDDADLEEEERAILSMVHRKHADFAVGHGVAVHAEPAADPWKDESGWDRARSICTKVLPWYDVPVTETPSEDELRADFPEFEGFELDMRTLAELPREQLVTVLGRIPETYGKWIEGQRVSMTADPHLDRHAAAAGLALERAEGARARLAEGVETIRTNDVAFEAFQFANRAMRLQRLRTEFALRRRRGEDITFAGLAETEPAAWRVFQLAFLLLNVPTVVRLDHERRTSEIGSYADLLWFPTGGGKTEAYLGVAALAVGARRLQGLIGGYAGDGGVTVIMRYTLRLLTLQQFQRAATLVCALEWLRRQEAEGGDNPWGMEPFRIGLWVGNRATPGTTSRAKRWVESQKGDYWDASAGSSSPLQLTHCSWCGTKLGPDDLRVELPGSGRGRTFLFCPSRDCDFNQRNSPEEGLPVVTVDEEIYRLLPTFVLATVDKFAQMPWRGEVQGLFGRVVGKCPRHGWLGTEAGCTGEHRKRGQLPATKPELPPERGLRPPDLIIQDELHLISGPLGTLVGLYETAIDELCAWEVAGETVRPKVIASTATTRRAPEQVHRLFSREVEIFPPTGLEVADDFFSRQRPPGNDKPGRRYLGVCAPGRSRAAVLIRIYVAALAAAEWLWHAVEEGEQSRVDPYMTLLGYFNSLRELGGMRRLIEDDVDTRAFRVERDDRPGMKQRKLYPNDTVQELTSRVRSSRIPEILDQLEDTFTRYRDPAVPKGAGGRPLDIVLATNMVSVGVDVQRLGLMVVAGQPKATAEYIQATSRVGRRADRPGLVVTMLNWARPRDLSHYEQFEQYHAVFYKYVEALSLTPFAPRALDRGLTGVLASIVRLDSMDYSHNHGADEVEGAGQFPEIVRAITDRARNSAFGTEAAELGTRVRQEVAARLDEWGAEASEPGRRLGYREPRGQDRDGVTLPLLKRPGTGPWERFTVPNSMREVEPGVGLIWGGGGSEHLPDWEFRPSDARDAE